MFISNKTFEALLERVEVLEEEVEELKASQKRFR